MRHESFDQPKEGVAFGVRATHKEDARYHIRGDVFFTLRDGATGEIQEERELRNLVVLDASILIARLMKDNVEPPHGIYALAVGTGDVGWGSHEPSGAYGHAAFSLLRVGSEDLREHAVH
jgi:hypothetical protein